MSTWDVITRLRAQGAPGYQAAMEKSAKSVEGVGGASEKTSKKIGGTIKRWAGAAAAGYTATKVLGDSVKNAVDLGEQINKTAVVFRGGGGKAVLDWSKGTATAIGVSRAQALEAAGTFGNMLVPMGFARKQAAGMSTKMVDLAGDMASFNNASPEQTLEAVRSGLAGETEPLRRFGVFLSDARVKQEALNKHLWSGKGQMSASAKAAATYALILKDTKDAQGDFTRTSDSLANRQRILKAQYANITATLGQKLVPVISFLANHLGAVVAVVGTLVTLWAAYTVATKIAAAANVLFGVTMSAWPIFLIIAGIVALAAGFVLLYTKVGWFRDAVNATWNWIKTNWPLLLAILAGPFGAAVLLIIKNFDRIKKVASEAAHWIASRFRDLVEFFRRLPGAIIAAIGDLGGKLKSKFEGLKGGGVPFVPGIQHGGTIARGGVALIGEAGPELLTLPQAARVTPLTPSMGAPALGGMQTTANFFLDRRLLMTAVAQADADQRARR